MTAASAEVKGDQAFVLAEVLVGLAIMGLAMASIASLFSLWATARERTHAAAAWAATRNEISSAFLGSIERAVMRQVPPSGGVFGRPTEVSFISWPANGSSRDDFVRTIWRYDPAAKILSLLNKDGSSSDQADAQSTNVVASFSYYERDSAAGSASLRSDWEPHWPAPAAIVLKLSPAQKGVQPTPVEYVGRIRANRPIFCAASMQSERCIGGGEK